VKITHIGVQGVLRREAAKQLAHSKLRKMTATTTSTMATRAMIAHGDDSSDTGFMALVAPTAGPQDRAASSETDKQ
jgi:hypothetical protein